MFCGLSTRSLVIGEGLDGDPRSFNGFSWYYSFVIELNVYSLPLQSHWRVYRAASAPQHHRARVGYTNMILEIWRLSNTIMRSYMHGTFLSCGATWDTFYVYIQVWVFFRSYPIVCFLELFLLRGRVLGLCCVMLLVWGRKPFFLLNVHGLINVHGLTYGCMSVCWCISFKF